MKFSIALLFIFFQTLLCGQTTSFSDKESNDSLNHIFIEDSLRLRHYLDLAQYASPWKNTETYSHADVQQRISHSESPWMFLLLVLLLLTLTYLKVAFSNELQELFQSIWNRNLAQQIYRMQSDELTLPSVLLHLHFILVMVLFTQFVLTKHFSFLSLHQISATLFLIFLFTFFYAGKIIALNFVGFVFEMKNITGEYIFHFTTICKTSGLTLLPALFVFYFAPEFFLKSVLYFSYIVLFAFFVLLVLRGLSTAKKIVYRNFYHFIIYVCVVEISPMFLLFKLLTKTIT